MQAKGKRGVTKASRSGTTQETPENTTFLY
jgi:hypothetical protein